MPVLHKNKAFATLLAAALGATGLHRIYMQGPQDRWFFAYASSVPLAALLHNLFPALNWFYALLPVLVAAITGLIEAFVIGLQSDEKWDAAVNAGSGKTSSSGGWLALTLVATLAWGAVLLIGTISRLFDLLYTGGAYG